MSLNFALIWAVPIAGMGALWGKAHFKTVLEPVYKLLDDSRLLRWIAKKYVYTKPEHSDYFATSILLTMSSFISLGTVFYWQLAKGDLPYWMIFAYYCSWVGIGGRIMGAAYTLAHREGHSLWMYKPWIRNTFGNFFENGLGVFFGNVPYNFTTSHVFIHHRLDGAIGDSFYEWDLDRTSLWDFSLYISRIFSHMMGISSYRFFKANGQDARASLLRKGQWTYFLVGLAILALTRSAHFTFWIYLQPFMCMTYFLAFINIGFHGFIEFDDDGKSIPFVNSTCIINGEDDYFGEDDHMAHHYYPNVFHRDLAVHQKSLEADFKKHKATVFHTLSILEISALIVFNQWDRLAEHFVDYSGEMTHDEIKNMLIRRAKRKETSYSRYLQYLRNPTPEAREEYTKSFVLSKKMQ
jgi:hypothetical protein